MHANHIHFFFGEHLGNIAQQALAIHRFYGHIDGVDAGIFATGGALAAPLHVNQPLAAAAHHIAQVGAIGTVNAHALAACNKAADGIRRRGLAAFGQLGEQRVHAHDQHAALARGRALAWLFDLHQVFVWRHGLGRAQQYFDVAQRKLVFADHFKQVFCGVKAQTHGQVVELDCRFALALQQFFHRFAPFGHGLAHGQGVEPCAHLGAGARAGQKAQLGVEPVARGAAFFGGVDFHGLAIFQGRVQRHHGAVHPRAPAAVAQRGVHAVGKVHRRGALGQLHNRRLRREHVNAVVKRRRCLRARREGGCRMTAPLASGQLALPGHELAQHRNFCVIGATGRYTGIAFGARLFVGPVGGHAVLGVLVHGLGANLHLYGLALGVAHHGVQRLVAVALGFGDVVVKLCGYGRKRAVHQRQRRVALVHRGHNHAQGADVKHLVKVE